MFFIISTPDANFAMTIYKLDIPSKHLFNALFTYQLMQYMLHSVNILHIERLLNVQYRLHIVMDPVKKRTLQI